MIFSLPARIISILCAYLYPAYETFKTLANRPGYETQSSRWLMYWAVIAFLTAFEYSVEFLVSWFPFYHEFKMLFLLFCVLPQTQGSTLIYQQLILPNFLAHEETIDQQLASLHTRLFAVFQDQLQRVLFSVFGYKAAEAAANAEQGPRGAPGLGGRRPEPGQPMPSGAGANAQDLWSQYGPSVMAAGANILSRVNAGAATPQQEAPQQPQAQAQSQKGGAQPRPRPQARRTGSSSSGAPSFPEPFVPNSGSRSSSRVGGQY